MLFKIFWTFFEKTGSIEAYLYANSYNNLSCKDKDFNRIEYTKAVNDME
ncbi:hypothetical protein [Alkaliphilus pronyensis]|nr:hypothetical protein [Alkaliphilus pronyensis]